MTNDGEDAVQNEEGEAATAGASAALAAVA